jgi:hypothetical protein
VFATAQNQAAKVDVTKIKAKLLTQQFIEGHIAKASEDDKRFTFEYPYQIRKPNAQAQAKYLDVQRRFNAALNIRSTSLDDLTKLQTEGRAAYKAAFEIEETPIPFELKGEKNLSIRTMFTPPGADGKTKKLTAAEIQKLKGDPRQPGYLATIKDLTPKEWVRVFLDRNKAKKDGDTVIYPVLSIIIIQEPKESDPFVIPGS